MTRKYLIAAVVVLAANGPALAGEIDALREQQRPAVSTKSRSQVLAELEQARAEGMVPRGGEVSEAPPWGPAPSSGASQSEGSRKRQMMNECRDMMMKGMETQSCRDMMRGMSGQR